VAVTEVEVDVLTGNHQVLRADILEDVGRSLSPEVDVGQIEGALVMGLGYFTSEETVYDPQTGKNLTTRTWTYKPPGAMDIPADLRINFLKGDPLPGGVLRSKSTGEPPLCMSCSVLFAIRRAVESARSDAGLEDEWFDMEIPYTTERIWMACKNKKEEFKLT